MDDHEARGRALLALYETEARELLESIGTPDLEDVDAAAMVVRRALTARRVLRVGFLGESQVGKSSIINALIGQRVLPSGGVGPLTAQATKIAFAPTPTVRARYHGRQRINQFRFALQRYLESLGEFAPSSSDGAAANEDGGEDDASEAFSSFDFGKSPEAEEGATEGPRRIGEYLVAQSRLMLGVATDMPRAEVFQLVRTVAARDDRLVVLPEAPALRERVVVLRRLLDSTEEFSRENLKPKEFGQALRVRAAGWMSPLVADLHVTLDLPLLRDAEMVDLPGVGVVADPAGKVAEEFVRKQADALVIVMRNNGLTEQIAGLLERTGVISRLLWSGKNSQAPIHVAVVVTRLDDVAKEQWRQRTLEARESGEALPNRESIFRDLAEQMAQMVRHQVAEALMNSREFDDLPIDLRIHREQVVRELSDRMTVLCVSAPDYLGLLEGFDDDCFLRVPDDTNVPRLVDQLTTLAKRSSAARSQHIERAVGDFSGLLEQTLDFQEHVRRDRKGARTEADARFRASLEAAATPLKTEAKAHRRAFNAFLAKSMPVKLEGLSERAGERARRRLLKQTTDGKQLSWPTLNAALVRNGAFQGAAHIDYPGSLTRAFVDVIGGSWEEMVVEGVRTAYRQLNEADAELVERLCGAASEILGTEELNVATSDLRRQLREQSKVSIAWTQAQLEELSDDVRVKLIDVVAKPIEAACRTAHKAGQNRGAGARDRILEVFQAGGTKAIERAREACMEILRDHLERLGRSLGAVLRENYDPVTHVFETIIGAQSDMVAKLGDQHRREQLSSVRAMQKRVADVKQGRAPLHTSPALEEPISTDLPPIVAASDTNVRDVGADIFDGL